VSEIKPVGFKLFLTEEERNELDTMLATEYYRSRGEYLTALVRRDLYSARCNARKQNELPIPGKTPAEYEAQIQRYEKIIQTQSRMIGDLKKQLKS